MQKSSEFHRRQSTIQCYHELISEDVSPTTSYSRRRNSSFIVGDSASFKFVGGDFGLCLKEWKSKLSGGDSVPSFNNSSRRHRNSISTTIESCVRAFSPSQMGISCEAQLRSSPIPGFDFNCQNSGSRRSSTSSNVSIASFVGREYAAMMEEWVDECVNEGEARMMAFVGNEFKLYALRPHVCHDALIMESDECSERSSYNCGKSDSKIVRRKSFGKSRRNSVRTLHLFQHVEKSRRKQYAQSSPWEENIISKTNDALLRAHFNTLEWSPDELCAVMFNIFLKIDPEDKLLLSKSRIQRFILSVRDRMIDNAYHNWSHVVDVAQTVFNLSKKSGMFEKLQPKRRLALLIAGLCHDIEHPGVNTSYLVKSHSTLAAWYKMDPGLLERHHSLRCFELLTCGNSKLLQNLTDADKLEVAHEVRELIMATDMRRHGAFMEALQERLWGPNISQDEDSEVSLLEMQLLLKCADISNVFKPLEIAKEWAVRVTDEMFSQGDMERANGLEVTPLFDSTSQTRVGLQTGFIDAVVMPFLRQMVNLYAGLESELAQLESNRGSWDALNDDLLLEDVRLIVQRRVSDHSVSLVPSPHATSAVTENLAKSAQMLPEPPVPVKPFPQHHRRRGRRSALRGSTPVRTGALKAPRTIGSGAEMHSDARLSRELSASTSESANDSPGTGRFVEDGESDGGQGRPSDL